MITVIIPLYNKEKSIAKTINSVIKQSYTDFEIIVVDDGSTDGGVPVVCSFTDSRIRLIKKKNGGVSDARNRGIKEAKGDYLFFLDADDEITNDCFAVLLAAFNNYKNADIIFANSINVHNGHSRKVMTRKSGYISNNLKELYLGAISLRTGNFLAKKHVFYCNYFNTSISIHEDTEILVRLMKKYKIAFIDNIVHIYNMNYSELSLKNVDIKKEFAYYIDLGKCTEIYERKILADNLVCSIKNRIFKHDYKTALFLLFKNINYLYFLVIIYFQRKYWRAHYK